MATEARELEAAAQLARVARRPTGGPRRGAGPPARLRFARWLVQTGRLSEQYRRLTPIPTPDRRASPARPGRTPAGAPRPGAARPTPHHPDGAWRRAVRAAPPPPPRRPPPAPPRRSAFAAAGACATMATAMTAPHRNHENRKAAKPVEADPAGPQARGLRRHRPPGGGARPHRGRHLPPPRAGLQGRAPPPSSPASSSASACPTARAWPSPGSRPACRADARGPPWPSWASRFPGRRRAPRRRPPDRGRHASGHNAQIAMLLGTAAGLVDAGAARTWPGTPSSSPSPPRNTWRWSSAKGWPRRSDRVPGRQARAIRLGEFDHVDLALMTHTSSNPEDGLLGISSQTTAASSSSCVTRARPPTPEGPPTGGSTPSTPPPWPCRPSTPCGRPSGKRTPSACTPSSPAGETW